MADTRELGERAQALDKQAALAAEAGNAKELNRLRAEAVKVRAEHDSENGQPRATPQPVLDRAKAAEGDRAAKELADEVQRRNRLSEGVSVDRGY
jgi:CTP:molybdopterin cytidylyltransferase MocA